VAAAGVVEASIHSKIAETGSAFVPHFGEQLSHHFSGQSDHPAIGDKRRLKSGSSTPHDPAPCLISAPFR
jgi:hypothetical protein